jgi:hypothetical protein
MEPYTVRGVSRIEKQQEIIKEQQIKKQLEQDQLKQQQSVKIEPETKEQGDAKEGTQHVEVDKNENPNNANISTQSIENEVQPEDDDDFDENSSSYSNNYKLVGIVVHSGQANGGHYYSFIQHKSNSSTPTNDEDDLKTENSESIGNQNSYENNWYVDIFFNRSFIGTFLCV